MHEFLSPLSNRRDDEYGGSLASRMRFPLEVFCRRPCGVARKEAPRSTHLVHRLDRRRMGPRAVGRVCPGIEFFRCEQLLTVDFAINNPSI